MQKTAVILMNLGTPDAPDKKSVGKFLAKFLNDPRVIDLPFLARKLLVNLIIVPFRKSKSSKMYQKVWTENGSPIIFHGNNLVNKLNAEKKETVDYFLAMRFGEPSLTKVMEKIRQQHYSKIVFFSLFPQYASSTSGSVIEYFLKIIEKWTEIPNIQIISEFYNHSAFINSWVQRIEPYNPNTYDHILFSFHGLPVNQVEETHFNETCEVHKCLSEINQPNRFCYQAQCYETTRLIASKLGLKENDYTVCFQSRFGKTWLQPYADKTIEEKAKQGVKKLLLLPLSFVADCLETNYEIATEYAELFKELDGEKLQMVESLNSEDYWVEAIKEIIM